MFYIAPENALEITKGRTEEIEVAVFNDDGTGHEWESGELAMLFIKHNPADQTETLRKAGDTSTNGKAVFTINASDTTCLQPGDYYYEVVAVSDGIHPIIRLSLMHIMATGSN